jgi:ABC-type dipeptide/oligopeptide/nickel transport system permease subunit
MSAAGRAETLEARSGTSALSRVFVHLLAAARRHPALTLSLLFLLVVVLLAIFAQALPYSAYRQNILHRDEVPSLKHWLGTDELGRDVLARIAVGARVSLIVAATATLIAVAIGVMVGTLSAYIGGLADSVLMRFVDSMYAFPDTLFAILMAALIKGQLSTETAGLLAPFVELYRLSGGLLGVLLTLGLTGWLTTSRLVRSQVLSLKSAEYVLACRLAGASDWFIIRTHLLPNVAPVILLSVTFIVPNAILLEAGLSFMGIGVDPPTPSWGTMIASGTQSIQSFPHLLIVPALAIGLTLLALNVIGDAARDLLDPALRGSRRA